MKIYKENQQYHDLFSIGVLATLVALMVYKIVNYYFILNQGLPLATLGLLLLSITGAVLFYKQLKLKIRLSPNKLSLRIDHLPWANLQINKKEVEGIEFFKVTEAELCTGWAMDFGHRSRIFNFGDKAGLIVHKNNGKQVVVFSKQLYQQADSIKKALKKHDWNVTIADG